MDIRKVKKLIELLEESNIDELEIKEGEESVRISRNSGAAAVAAPRQQRADNQRPRDQIAHGRHLLPLTVSGLSGLC